MPQLCHVFKSARLRTITSTSRTILSTLRRAHASASVPENVGPKGYWTLEEAHCSELEVKKSKFFTTAWPVTSAAMSMELIAAASDPSASHNCFAYKIGNEYRSSDDGEPGGTAGRPILSAIEAEGLDAVCVLVVRHFGGTKLGAGGLARAYGTAARQCLQEAQRTFCEAKVNLEMELPFDAMGAVFNLLERAKAERLSEDYSRGNLVLKAAVPAAAVNSLVLDITNSTSGRTKPVVVD